MNIRAVPAVTRAVAILRLLGRAREPMGMKAIAQALELVPSTGLHILRALVAEELVKVDPVTKQYSLGSGLISLARTALESDDFPNRVQPQLDDLSRCYGVSAIGVELPNLRHMIVVALARSQAPVRLHVDVGSRFPALISATGRCLAAFGTHPAAEIEKHFRALRWNNAPSYEAWLKEIETVRRQGYSIDRGNYIAGVTIVAVPVLNAQGTISHTLASVGLSGQLDRPTAVALAHDMQAAAGAVAA
ncbi:MAG TPA: IclR family transcriptional regulator C-terminal domain-containing protein [Reyranella sp.]|nr:IclR family transcriptional regulator C-terminal domain-containing protein [Reyranella sp.]